MSPRRVLATLSCVVVALGLGGSGTAFAASPPPNDLIGGATVVSTLPFSDTVDTTAATTDANDTQVNQSCGAPATNNSVWYTFTAGPSDTLLAVDTTGSTFSSGVIIATGTPGALTTRACGPTTAKLAVASGTTYYIMVFDDSGSGGTLHISMHGPGPVPANDTIFHAAPLTRLPFHATLDTTGATTDANDAQANQSCGAPATGNTVWYKFTPGLSHNLFFDASRSDYPAGFLIATASEGALTTVACGPVFVTAALQPHTTYFIMIFDFTGGGGGTLRLNVGNAPTVALGVQKYAHIDSHGVVRVTGTYSCAGATHLHISGSLFEIVGDKVPSGNFDTLGVPAAHCDRGRHAWTGLVLPSGNAHFAPGKAAAFTSAQACGRIACAFANTTTVVQLTGSGAGTGAAPHVRDGVRTRIVPRSTGRRYGNARHAATATWSH
jgi:hypothetical protein